MSLSHDIIFNSYLPLVYFNNESFAYGLCLGASRFYDYMSKRLLPIVWEVAYNNYYVKVLVNLYKTKENHISLGNNNLFRGFHFMLCSCSHIHVFGFDVVMSQIEAMAEDVQPLLAEVRDSGLLKEVENLTKSLTQASEDLR